MIHKKKKKMMLLKHQSTVILKCENIFSILSIPEGGVRCHLRYHVSLMPNTEFVHHVAVLCRRYLLFIYIIHQTNSTPMKGNASKQFCFIEE